MDLRELVERLVAAVPEFRESEYGKELERDLPYCVFGDFALYVRDEVCRGEDEALLTRVCEFVNSLAALGLSTVDNLLMTGFFEVVSDYEEATAIMRKGLSDEAKKLLDDIVAYWQGEM